MTDTYRFTVSTLFFLILFAGPGTVDDCLSSDSTASDRVQYNRDVRPILADRCFRCHGPDAAARQADLRFDDRANAVVDRGGYQVIAPGQPTNSELFRRITSTDVDEQMPPQDSGIHLSTHEIETLRRWIEQGADYQPHWSFIAPQRQQIPEVESALPVHTSIDRFVLKRLQDAGLTLSAPAEDWMLIRRLTLDLTGLPPSPEEIDAFEQAAMADRETAYQHLITRLLNSPRYGERMAQGWLDAARFADTNGYFTDEDRTMWPWRDWVIRAFNDNMRFDQFTIQQLAGDLLPDATIDQRIATGFNRNHMVNNETGIIEEEFRVEYVVDRVDTTATVWMGLTVACARCHDHKYDPISQKDFYRLFSFFNNVPERGLSGSSGNSAPVLQLPAAHDSTAQSQLQSELDQAEQEFAAIQDQIEIAQQTWESKIADGLHSESHSDTPATFGFDGQDSPTSQTGEVAAVDGIIGRAAGFDGDACLSAKNGLPFDRTDAFSIGAWINPENAGCIVSTTDDAREMRGFDITLRKGKAIINLVHRWGRNAIQIATVKSLPSRQWQHLMVTVDGSSKAAGVRVFLDGLPQKVDVLCDNLTGTITNEEPLRFGQRAASASLKGKVDEVVIFHRQLNDTQVAQLVADQLVRGMTTAPSEDSSGLHRNKLRSLFLARFADQSVRSVTARLEQIRKRQSALFGNAPTTMVMEELESPRSTFLLLRGEYDQHGDEVQPGVPRFLSSDGRMEGTASRTDSSFGSRLDLANWLMDPGHPLTARVTVNRLWQQLFGTGIVKTVDDFGTQGEWPSHPELLDWLAMELMESGWNIQHVLRLIVTSATYRQTSDSSPHSYAVDPENRLLSRGPRFRMDAEMVRDNALAVSGLLVEKVGGPSVKPYQPAGLWKDVTYDGDSDYQQDTGESLYRRSLYTFWKRQSPPPAMLVFDAPTRETCVVQRSRTNTPLQALALMNDPTFVEAARKLAGRTMMQCDSSADRAAFAFRCATSRKPTDHELRILLAAVGKHRAHFDSRPDDSAQLISVGDSKRNTSLDPKEFAAWTAVTSMILSLDETITRR